MDLLHWCRSPVEAARWCSWGEAMRCLSLLKGHTPTPLSWAPLHTRHRAPSSPLLPRNLPVDPSQCEVSVGG
jgi:hypothetical protein